MIKIKQEARKYKSAEEFREALRKTPENFKKIRESFARYEKVKRGEIGFNVGAIKMINDPFVDFYNQAVKGAKEVKLTPDLESTIRKATNEAIKRLDGEINKIYIVGSYAKGTATLKSDIDIVIQFKKKPLQSLGQIEDEILIEMGEALAKGYPQPHLVEKALPKERIDITQAVKGAKEVKL